MTILNKASDGLPSVLVALSRCIAAEGAMPQEKLLALVAPKAVCDIDMARKTINSWRKNGFFSDSEEAVGFHSDVHDAIRRKPLENDTLGTVVRSVVLKPENNENFWDSEGSRTADFTRTVAWILAQDVWKSEFVGADAPQELERNQIVDDSKRLLQNETRWPGFKGWATFLGFGWFGRFPKKDAFVIDPTVAVRDALAEVFCDQSELDQMTFFARLSECLPVLDSGVYRRKVEEILDPQLWSAPSEDEVSTSLSRSLERLHASGLLQMERRADAPNGRRFLLGRGRIRTREVTHLLRKRVGK